MSILRVVRPVNSYALPAASALALCLAGPAGAASTGADPSPLLESSMPEVLSTTRLRQPKSRVPGTTTILQGQLIRDLGLLSLAEVFRLVPGMTVGYFGNNNPVVSYHGTVAHNQRRLQVQIDGRTAYQPSLANVDWNAMPVAIENIERIEISRGPNAAAYGINAFLATINIITRSPEDTQGVNLHAVYGEGNYRNMFGSVGDISDDYGWRLSYQRRDDDGFDYRISTLDDGQLVKAPFNNGYSYNTFSYDADKTLNSRHSLSFSAGVTDGTEQEDILSIDDVFGATTQPDIDVDDYYLQGKWNYVPANNHFMHVQLSYQDYTRRQRWRSCPLGTGLCADTNNDMAESRVEVEIQDTVILTNDLRFVSGLGYREDRYESETFFNGKGHDFQSRIFGNLEYTPITWLTFNVGGNWERTTTLNHTVFSPRLAANFQLADNQTLRFVFSKAVRTPDAFEQSADWGYRMHNVSPDAFASLEGERLGPTFQAPGTLGEERIISREISYFGQFRLASGLLSTEVKYFHDDLRDMISGYLNIDEWDLSNNVALDQQGVELEASLEYPNTQFRLTYAYMDQDGRYTGGPVTNPGRVEGDYVQLEDKLTVQHSASAVWIQRYPFDISTSTGFYYIDQYRRNQYERLDLRVAKRVYTSRLNYDVAVIFQHYSGGEPPISRNNNIKNKNQFYIEAGVRF